jgi:hypothetical protein
MEKDLSLNGRRTSLQVNIFQYLPAASHYQLHSQAQTPYRHFDSGNNNPPMPDPLETPPLV